MKYNAGDRVRIKSLDWYNENKDRNGNVRCGEWNFTKWYTPYCGAILTIRFIWEDDECYKMIDSDHHWTDEMIEGLVEEEVGLIDKLSSRWVNEFNLPDGYIFKDENGNVINATKIVLEKKKKKYPKTFEECCEILKGEFIQDDIGECYVAGYFAYELECFQKLLICRDAYWKIAGEEMRLGKPWEPDWTNEEWPDMAYISYDGKSIDKENGFPCCNMILIFPYEEMRDAFYENFKELIEQCKELL